MSRVPKQRAIYVIVDQKDGETHHLDHVAPWARPRASVIAACAAWNARAPAVLVGAKFVPRYRVETFRWVPVRRAT